MIQNSIQISEHPSTPPKGLVPFRQFASALAQFSDFDAFRESLIRIVTEDSGYAGILELDKDLGTIPDSEVGEHFVMDNLVVPFNCGEENGFIRFVGNVDGHPFSTEDLMWMGAIAEFVSLAYANSRAHQKSQEKARVLQYLVDQLPLAVVCFDAKGGLLVENKWASRLLGDSGAELMRGILSDKALKKKSKARMHLEVGGRLLYAEGRRLDVDKTLSVHAFALYDMSGEQEKNLLQLEHSVFRAQSRQTSLTVAVLEGRSEAGRLYRTLKAAADSLQVNTNDILVLDAYTCACVFSEKRLRTARYLLKDGLPRSLDRDSVKGALVAEWAGLDDETPAQSLIDTAREGMRSLPELLRPALLVLDPYPAVLESLAWIGGEIASFEPVDDVQFAVDRVKSGEFDGLFLDVETFGDRCLESLQAVSDQVGDGFRIFYISHKQPSMVCSNYGLGPEATVFQKPFDAEKLRQTLALQFDLP